MQRRGSIRRNALLRTFAARAVFPFLTALALALVPGFGASPVSAQRPFPEPPDSLILANDFIEIVVNIGSENTGRFAVNTTGGDPTRAVDDYKPLIYSSPLAGPWASYTTVRIDGVDYVFGGETGMRSGRAGRYGEMVMAPQLDEDGRKVRSAWRFGDVTVTQELSIVHSITTGFPDTAQITYHVTNNGTRMRRVGLRMMLDTLLGENDGAPFRVRDEAITGDRVLEADAIPQFYQAFDSLSNPRVMSQGTLWGDDATPPDAIYFSNWGSLADGVWEFDFQPGREFLRAGEFELDSALALYWYPAPLEPGATRTYTTYYGLGGITIVAGELALGLTSPAQVSGHPRDVVTFPVVAYVENTGEGVARDVTATLTLPPGLSLAPGEAATKELGHLQVGETAQASWTVQVAPGASGNFTYRVAVSSSTSEPNQAQRSVQVIAPAELRAELSGPRRLEVVNDRWTPVPIVLTGTITNTGGLTAHGVTARLETPVGLSVARGDTAVKPIGPVEPGERVELTWHLIPTGWVGDLPASLRLEAERARIAGTPTHFIDVPHLDAKMLITTDGKGTRERPLRVGEYVNVRVEAVNLPDLQEVAFVLRYNPQVLQLVGGALGVERGNLFVRSEGRPGGAGGGDGVRYLRWEEPQVEAERGLVRIAAGMDPEGAPERANGVIATVRFRAVGPGESPLVLQPRTDWIFTGAEEPLEVLAVNPEGIPVQFVQGQATVYVSP